MNAPKFRPVVMVSSSFTDLEDHRRIVIDALHLARLAPEVMEFDTARTDEDVIDASFGFVRDSHAYVCVIGPRYGSTPYCADRNPDRRSLTELEFDEAVRLGRPILLFLADKDHKWREDDFEFDADRRQKLRAFRERAELKEPGTELKRVYGTFSSAEDLAQKAQAAIDKLASKLDQAPPPAAEAEAEPAKARKRRLPEAPLLRALPKYIGSHRFVGRKKDLAEIDAWAAPEGEDPVLLFEAMGGMGKSMLTWEWTRKHATRANPELAGRFWYSFYEDGAIMAEFCREALAYMTGGTRDDFAKLSQYDLTDLVVAELEAKPWLLVLDGLERVLVTYHRPDASAMKDSDAETAGDEIAHRDPLSAIRLEDDELLKKLTAVDRSKILISTRLTPKALVNEAGRPLPGVKRIELGGLTRDDAVKMLRAEGVRYSDEAALGQYVRENCDGHPLVIGALAGLIMKDGPARADFDKWRDAPSGGGALKLGGLDLKQRQNHILEVALAALSSEARALLQILSLLTGGADWALMEAINPHLPERPKPVEKPKEPNKGWSWGRASEGERRRMRETFERQRAAFEEYESSVRAWHAEAAQTGAPQRLQETVRDLVRYGLLQFDDTQRRYDLHPVVREVIRHQMPIIDRNNNANKLIDYFNAFPSGPWRTAENIGDILPGIQLVNILTEVNMFDEAARVLLDRNLAHALFARLDLPFEFIAIVRPFFHVAGVIHL